MDRGALLACSGIDYGLDDGAGLGDVTSDTLALWEKPVEDASEGLRNNAKSFGRDERVHDVHDCNVEPFFVAADFGTEEDAGREAGDYVENEMAQADLVPFFAPADVRKEWGLWLGGAYLSSRQGLFERKTRSRQRVAL